MDKTKIDWCDSTFNPITGCRHGCEYCYARGIINRFASRKGCRLIEPDTRRITASDGSILYEMNEQAYFLNEEDWSRYRCAYPHGFIPTLHRYRMGEYKDKQRPRNIFVGSTADLFGGWVPLEWQLEVFEDCRKGPQHNYIFLTKNPGMYSILDRQGILPTDSNMWFGTSVTTPDDPFPYNGRQKHNLFLSIEPLLADFGEGNTDALRDIGWVIIGAETGNRKSKVIPEQSWVENLVNQCRANGIPVFMKSSLSEIWGEPLIQEFPEGLRKGALHE